MDVGRSDHCNVPLQFPKFYTAQIFVFSLWKEKQMFFTPMIDSTPASFQAFLIYD